MGDDVTTLLVTGATAGFGRAIARRFARDGARLVLLGRRSDRLDALAAELAPLPVHTIVADLRDRTATFAAIDALPSSFAAVDILVNNAGLALGLEPAQRADLDDWDTMIDTNCRALVAVTRRVLPGMVARNRGHVVNIGSVAADYPYPGGNVYGATKAFVRQFSLNLRADLHGTAVRVTDVAPGLAETEFSQVRFKGDATRAQAIYRDTVPLTADDVADAVHWVATRPPHVNVNVVEIMPTVQSFQALAVHRDRAP
jgi:3-hydroxy acid dehydrogenase/malonic semialdehyde reductase